MSFEELGWYASIFFGLFFTGIGIPPVPEEVMIASAAGLTASHENLHWWLAWPATLLGILCADAVLYGLGRRYGQRLFRYRWVQRVVKPDRRQRLEERFRAHGVKILLTARLLPPLRTGVFLIAGAIHYSFLKFLLADGLYAVVGVGIFFFGSQWLIGLLLRVGHWAVWVLAGLVGVFVLYRYYCHLEKCEREQRTAPPESILELPPPDKEPDDRHAKPA